jgi:putative membrane protein
MYRNSNIFKNGRRWAGAGRRKLTQSNHDDRHYASHRFVWLIAAIVLLAVMAFVGSVVAHYYFPSTMPYYGYPFFGWFFFPFGFIIFFLLIFFVVRLVFWPMGGWGGRRRYGYHYGYGDSREILRRRYAMGEITKDQYEQMMRDLEQHP